MSNQVAIDFLKKAEGCKLVAYPDPATGAEPWTIGYGQTRGIKQGMVWTQEQADDDLVKTVDSLEKDVDMLCRLLRLKYNTNQMAALISFTYNLGFLNLMRLFCGSENPKGCIDSQKLAKKMLDYDYAAGKPNQGLLNRRMRESALFLPMQKPNSVAKSTPPQAS